MRSVLDSRQLLAARALADTGSFTLAGRHLSLTQSAVSHAIKTLEEELECQLFARTGKGVQPTPAGIHFLQHIDLILEQMETARTLVAPRTLRGKDRLRLGVGLRVREYVLPVVTPAFQKQFPNRLVVLDQGDYRRSLALLESGLLDMAFIIRPAGPSALGYSHLFEDELRFVVSPGHPWARRGRASLDDLEGDTLLVCQQFNNIAQLVQLHLQGERIAPRHAVELAEYKPIKTLAATGRAVGVLPAWLAVNEVRDGSLVSLPIGARPLIRQWGLAYQTTRPLRPLDRTFVELCQQAVPGILSRLQGQATPPLEKKADPSAVLPDEKLRYGGVALGLVAAVNFLGDTAAWLEWAALAAAVA